MSKKDILFNGTIVGSYDATDDEERDAAFVHEFLVSKGLIKEIPQHAQVHGQANAFAEVANEVYAKGLKVSPYKGTSAPPFVVNATLQYPALSEGRTGLLRVKGLGACDAGVLFTKLPAEGKAVFEQAATDIAPLSRLTPGDCLCSHSAIAR